MNNKVNKNTIEHLAAIISNKFQNINILHDEINLLTQKNKSNKSFIKCLLLILKIKNNTEHINQQQLYTKIVLEIMQLLIKNKNKRGTHELIEVINSFKRSLVAFDQNLDKLNNIEYSSSDTDNDEFE